MMLHEPHALGCEQYRTLRTELFHAAERELTQIIVITSAIAGEGKTATTLNLALAIAQSPNRRVLVTSHDAFNYFCQAYGFTSAAPEGWSTANEVGAGVTADSQRKTIESIREHGVKAIFVETSVNKKLIQSIAEEAGVEIGGELYSDSMGAPGTAGETYVGMMRENVLTIVNALK